MAERVAEAGVMVLYEASSYSAVYQTGVMVLHETAPATHRARVAGVMALYEASTAVAEATVDLLAGKPEQFYLIHDALAVGASVVLSAGSEFGPRVGPPQPGTSNQGSILPSIIGDPDDNTDITLGLEIVRGGGVGSAEWCYESEAGTWYGQNDMLYLWGTHTPKGTGTNLGGILLYSSVYRRVLVLSVNAGAPGVGSIEIRYADADDRPQTNTDWSSAGNFTPEGGVNSDVHAICGVELRDGSLLVAVRGHTLSASQTNNLAQGDLQIYRSVDGGLNWVQLAERVLTNAALASGKSTTFGRYAGNGMFRMAASGDWVRIAYPNDDAGLSCVVSADGGATWKYIDTDIDTSLIEAPGTANDHDEQPFDMIGLDDNAGTFLIAFRGENGSSLPQLYFGYASRDDDWSFSDLLDGATWAGSVIRSMAFIRDPYRLWLYVQNFRGDTSSSTVAYDRWTIASVPRSRAIVKGEWTLQQDVLLMHYAARYEPIQMTGQWLGDRGALLYYIEDSEQVPPNYVNERPYLTYVGGWSGRPSAVEFGAAQRESLHWHYVYGVPAGLPASASSTWASDWSATLSGGGTFAWGVQGLAFQTSGIADAAYQEWSQAPASFATQPDQWDHDADEEAYKLVSARWMAEWVLAVGATSPTNSPNVAMHVKMPAIQGAGNDAWNLTVRHGPGSIVLYNQATDVPLLTLSGLSGLQGSFEDGTRYFRCRLIVSPATTEPSFMIAAREETGGEWSEAGPIQIARATLTISNMSLQFGNLLSNTGSTVVSRWREFKVASFFMRTNYAHPDGFAVPGDLPGALAALSPYRLGAGSTASDPARLKVLWSGGSGVVGDTYTWEMQHIHPAEHMFLDSPQYPWLSAAGATAGTSVIFDAVGDSGRPNRWVHNAIALFDPKGAETVKVSYANSNGFSVGLTEQTISLVQHSGIPISESSGNIVGFLGTVAGATQIRDGALVGKYIKITSEISGSGRVGHVHKVVRHWRDADTHFLELSGLGQFDPDSILVGDTVSVISDRVMYRWSGTDQIGKRYMKLQFGATGENNWDGRWGLARLIVGIAKKFDPPLQWQYSDNQTPDVSEVRGRSGASWVYKNAEPERRIMGRWTGSIHGEHRAFRDALANLAGYQQQPIALLLDDDNRTGIENDLLLTRFDGSVGLDQQAWRMDDAHGNLVRPVGDMQVFFKELI